MTFDVHRYVTLEGQMCTWCRSQGKGWVRLANVADMVTLRHGRTEAQALAAYRARRRRAVLRHYRTVHPSVGL